MENLILSLVILIPILSGIQKIKMLKEDFLRLCLGIENWMSSGFSGIIFKHLLL